MNNLGHVFNLENMDWKPIQWDLGKKPFIPKNLKKTTSQQKKL